MNKHNPNLVAQSFAPSRAAINFLTCGHVDDGKSTLIGRLLYDIEVVPEDHIAAATDAAGKIDFSLFTDGLEDERRQGITIDVAYRYFQYRGQRFRIADTPGHLEYMRNMAVAAVDADIAVILADAVHGVRLQTVQYSKIAKFFGVRRFIVAINKMDAVEYAQSRFEEIRADYLAAFDDKEGVCDIDFIPVSALAGDNVVRLSDNTPWYQGETLLALLQKPLAVAGGSECVRLPVQHMVKDESGTRHYLGTVRGGSLKIGDKLHCADSDETVTIKGITSGAEPVKSAPNGAAVAIAVTEDADICRGAVLSLAGEQSARATDGFNADILWLDKKYEQKETFQGLIKIHHREEQIQVTLHRNAESDKKGALIPAYGHLANPIPLDTYADNPQTGLFLLLDPYSERVVGVGTVAALILNTENAEPVI